MYNFASDYLEGAHPQVMEALNKTNFIQTVGYGEDQYCQKAKDKIKAILENENVDIHFLVGGTQTNMIMISSALKDYQAVIAVDSGHINVHETGAVEFTGHKILTKPHQDGKMIPEMIDEIMREHPDEHMVQPKMVYISQTTEYGTYYTLEELKGIYECCQQNNLYLFIDGARLGSALVLKDAPTLQEMALYSDVFYIGGTKMGALFGECLVIINDELKKVTVDGEEVKLTPIEYNILLLLMKNKGKVFSISQIYEEIWNEEAIGADNTVAVHIRHIREKIEINPKEPRYLKVVWGVGYKIEAGA